MVKKEDVEHEMWSLRVDKANGADDDSLSEWLSDLGGAYLLSFETGEADENEHYHAWIYYTSKEQALRKRFLRRFTEIRGNKSYSLVPVREPENYKRYCVKGTKDKPAVVVCYHGVGDEYTEAGIVEMRKTYWELKAATAKEIEQKRKERAKDFREHVWEKCANIDKPTYRKVAGIIYDAYVDADKMFDTYAIKRLTNITMAKLDRRRGKTDFKEAVLNDLMTGAGYAFDMSKQNVSDYQGEIDI